MGELVIASKCQLDGNAETLDRHDGNATDCAADRNVDEWVLAAVRGGNAIDHYNGEGGHGGTVEEEEGLKRVVEHSVNCFDGLVRRCVEYDYDSAEETG